jgi:hypothetical protein
MVKKKGDKNKNHVEYICICGKSFGNHKYHYENHLNKKNPCKPKTNLIQIENICNINNTDGDEKNNHFNSGDEITVNIDEKQIIDNDNINFNQDNSALMAELIKKIDYLIKQNEEFKKQNEKFNEDIRELKEDNEKLKNQIVGFDISKNTVYNNNINVNIQINNFNNMDYSKIDKKQLINTILQNSGKQIYLKAIENIFVNPEKPENHNLYIADKNRKYVKKYNNGRWETDNLGIIDLLINNFVDYYKLSLEEIKQKPDIYNKLKNNIQTKLKYLDLCDLDYLENLEDQQENDEIDNKKQIKRCKEFREMVYKEMINLLHDKKDIVLKTHKNNVLEPIL